MIRIFLFLLTGLFLSLVETSFISSLQGAIRFTPFVFVLSVYLLQHHSVLSSVGWIVLHGWLIDMLQWDETPFYVIATIIGALVAFFCAQKIFSNRSLYGVVACTLVSYTSFIFVEILLRLGSVLRGSSSFFWRTYLSDVSVRYAMLLIFVILLFLSAKQIRVALNKSFLFSQSRSSY